LTAPSDSHADQIIRNIGPEKVRPPEKGRRPRPPGWRGISPVGIGNWKAIVASGQVPSAVSVARSGPDKAPDLVPKTRISEALRSADTRSLLDPLAQQRDRNAFARIRAHLQDRFAKYADGA